MSRKRIAVFILMYVVIIIAMLLVYFSVQKEYGADPERPYQRRFFLRLPLLELPEVRLAATCIADSPPPMFALAARSFPGS